MNNFETATLLKKLRKDYNYTIQKIANLLDVSKAAVSKWESGYDIKTEHLYELSKLYNVSFSELYYGKLKKEKNADYWRRNYDLSNFELKEDINAKNVDNLKTLFDHCNMVKKRFYKLLPRWGENKLTSFELEEFEFLKQYFKFDINYYANNKIDSYVFPYVENEVEKAFVLSTLSKIRNYDIKSYNWELTKLYNFTYNYNVETICNSENIKALEYLLSTFSQIEKDSILYDNLHIVKNNEETQKKCTYDRTIYEIEQIPYFKTIINSGANKLYERRSSNNVWEDVIFESIEGKITELDESIYYKYQFYDYSGRKYIPVISNWKLFSYEEYLNFIDKKGTEQLKDIVNLKNSNPLKYFERMIERESIDA